MRMENKALGRILNRCLRGSTQLGQLLSFLICSDFGDEADSIGRRRDLPKDKGVTSLGDRPAPPSKLPSLDCHFRTVSEDHRDALPASGIALETLDRMSGKKSSS